jgi:hypothetical protein
MKFLFWISPVFAGGIIIGSGGDALREVYFQAQTAAAAKVSKLSRCAFTAETPPEVVEWLMTHQGEYAAEIKGSHLVWQQDADRVQNSCAFTAHAARADILLSYRVCQETGNDADKAFFVLAHEASHHLGVDDEDQADAIARAVQTADPSLPCGRAEDFFEADICPGELMSAAVLQSLAAQAGSGESQVGQFEVVARRIRCEPLKVCDVPRPLYLELSVNGERARSLYAQFQKTPAGAQASFVLDTGTQKSSFPLKMPAFLAASLPPVHPAVFTGISAEGKSYEVNTKETPNHLANFRFAETCLWSKWIKTETETNGTTESTEVVLFGRW